MDSKHDVAKVRSMSIGTLIGCDICFEFSWFTILLVYSIYYSLYLNYICFELVHSCDFYYL
jgi:hypothetical protein